VARRSLVSVPVRAFARVVYVDLSVNQNKKGGKKEEERDTKRNWN
jgi:hypothetical protein